MRLAACIEDVQGAAVASPKGTRIDDRVPTDANDEVATARSAFAACADARLKKPKNRSCALGGTCQIGQFFKKLVQK